MRDNDRRATVILIQRGDPEISGAIAEGMLTARAVRPLEPEQAAIVSAEMDRQKIAALVHVAVGNSLTAEDYRYLIEQTRKDCEAMRKRPGPLRRIARAMVNSWAMICYAIGEAYDAQRHVLGGPER